MQAPPPGSLGLVVSTGPVARPPVVRTPERLGTPRQVWVALALVLVVFVALATTIAVKTPAWESNDEPDHVQNIETLVAGHWYGMHVDQNKTVVYRGNRFFIGTSSGTEAHQAPLYYLLLAAWQLVAGVPARMPNPGPGNIGYPSRGAYAHHSAADHRFLLWLRLPNVVFGALTIWFTFLAARILAKNPWTPVVAAAIIGFLPRFVFLSAFVTNDNLVNLLGAILAFVSLRCLKWPSPGRMALVGGVVGLLITTKISTLPFAFVVIVLALAQREWLKRLQLVCVGAVACIAVCGWYLIQNAVRYGDPLALGASQTYLSDIGGIGTPYGVAYTVPDPLRYVVVDVPATFLREFWYGSGWQEIFHWPWPVGLVLFLGLAVTLLGLVGRHISKRALVVLVVLTVAGFLSVWIVAFQTKTYDPRLALGGVPALTCLSALGLERWRVPVRFIFPLVLLGATIYAVQTNVLAVPWS
jgi:Dolichyl-phosphate-mannose-protein mannosyltransferase